MVGFDEHLSVTVQNDLCETSRFAFMAHGFDKKWCYFVATGDEVGESALDAGCVSAVLEADVAVVVVYIPNVV